jgi:hypothetical protein
MAHFLFNFSAGGRDEAAALLQAHMWGVGSDERYSDALAPGDVALIYVEMSAELIGRAEIATSVRAWTPPEAEVFPGDAPRGVLLRNANRWNPPVAMESVVSRIDPAGSNPYVQENAALGFRMGVVRITDDEYGAAVALSREARAI